MKSDSYDIVPTEMAGTKRVRSDFYFDERDFINLTLDILTELHGSYNRHDEMLVMKLATAERDLARCEDILRKNEMQLLQETSHSTQASCWFNMRERLIVTILKIRKDLGMDLMSRKPIAKMEAGMGSFFTTSKMKEKETVESRPRRN